MMESNFPRAGQTSKRPTKGEKIRRLEHQPRKSNLQINEFRKEKIQNWKKMILE